MARALHDPETGYYARRIATIGRGGDFTTAPMVSKLLARAIAAWAHHAMLESGCRNLIEVGPGNGRLAADVRQNLPWLTQWKTGLHLVETSHPLAAHQKKLLGRHASWHSSLGSALAACGGKAVIYSNELVDAFPVRRFRKTLLGWQELALTWDSGQVRESLLPVADLPDSTIFSQSHPIGQWVEVHESYQKHLNDWLDSWKRGRLLTIDYGSLSNDLYHRKPQGSIRGYLHHQRLEGMSIYQNPGRQDLTADVNFSDLQHWCAPHGVTHALVPLYQFIRRWAGSGGLDPFLTSETGAGNAFLVLEQSPAAEK